MNIRQLWQEWLGWAGVCAAIAAIAVAGVLHLQLRHALDSRTERVRFLENEVRKLNRDVEDVLELRNMIQEVLARKASAEAIRKDREHGARLLEQAARLRPAGIRIDQLRFDRRYPHAYVAGTAESRSAIALLLKNWKDSPYFGEPVQVEIAPAAADGGLKFNYRAVMR